MLSIILNIKVVFCFLPLLWRSMGDMGGVKINFPQKRIYDLQIILSNSFNFKLETTGLEYRWQLNYDGEVSLNQYKVQITQ